MNIDLNKKQHVVQFEVPAVKLWFFTIRKAYTERRFIDCEAGDYCAVDEFRKNIMEENTLLARLKRNDPPWYKEDKPTTDRQN